MSNTLFIHSLDLHEAHRMFIETIDADFESAYYSEIGGLRRFFNAFKRAREYPNYPIYLLEGGIPMFPAYLKKRKNKEIKMIGLLADETFINLVKRQPHYSFVETFIHKISAKCLDGAIAVSPFIKSYAEKIVDIPIEVARPPISQKNYNMLEKVKPNLDSNIIVSVGMPRFSIGMDILVRQFEYAKWQIPDLELWIIGKEHPKEYEKIDGVKVLGFIDDLSQVFKKASLFVHAGRCSVHSVATLEAMRAGIPVVVSNMTGAKDIVMRVENKLKKENNFKYEGYSFIQPINKIAKGIIAYYLSNEDERRQLSEECRRESEEFEPEKRCKHFKKVFEGLVEKIG